jgi:hypothetical protein
MSFPVIATLTLSVPPDEGLPPDEMPLVVTLTVDQRSIQKLKLTGSGSKVVDFGTIGGAGAKLIVVALDAGVGVLPITCRFNGGGAVGSQEVSPGGYQVLASPGPVSGNTSLEIFYTANANVRVWIFG